MIAKFAVILTALAGTANSFVVSPHTKPFGTAKQHAHYRLMSSPWREGEGVSGMEKVLFVQVGFGNDQHGQDPTKACVRACRNAIEFNSIPSINAVVPGGYANMKLRVQLAVPAAKDEVDLEEVKKVFPYGQLLPVELQRGGMRASSGIELSEMGDKGDDMIIAVSCVTVGY